MKIFEMKYFSLVLGILVFSLILATTGKAETYDCTVTAPTCASKGASCMTNTVLRCESLGYEQTVSECSGLAMLVCPFNSSKVFCGGSRTQTTSYNDFFTGTKFAANFLNNREEIKNEKFI